MISSSLATAEGGASPGLLSGPTRIFYTVSSRNKRTYRIVPIADAFYYAARHTQRLEAKAKRYYRTAASMRSWLQTRMRLAGETKRKVRDVTVSIVPESKPRRCKVVCGATGEMRILEPGTATRVVVK